MLIKYFLIKLILITFLNFINPTEINFNEKEENFSKNFKTLSCEEICPLTEAFFNRKCSIDIQTWNKVCPMTAELEIKENLFYFENLNENEIKIKIDLLNKKTEELIQKNEKIIDKQIKILKKGKSSSTSRSTIFDENGIIKRKNSNKFWKFFKLKKEEEGEWDGPVYYFKNKNILPKCSGWENLKSQFSSYWRLTKEVWNEYKNKPLGGDSEIIYFSEQKLEKFRKKGLKFFNLICERNFISKEKCDLIDENKVEKPKDFNKILNLFVKFILNTLIEKKVYSPLNISDEMISLIKAILTRKDFFHPTTLDKQITLKSLIKINQSLIRKKRMIEFGTILTSISIATKITIITFSTIGGIIGLIIIVSFIYFCI
ncbi:hypothetical protein Mgra_00005076 [Meloidogyne graminicola]|uniref:Uncharacterized protein n=1 Tax=Meloidogyne graminicola TaxID=189291 RepID=A0A8S9ZPZ9_9BILA|nr:hypothetical protein Mgra_00005076 [Meloidogyne graminicola]